VVDNSRQHRARAAEELSMLPEGSAVHELLAEYTVMRQRARA
jgi:hypothetical protein